MLGKFFPCKHNSKTLEEIIFIFLIIDFNLPSENTIGKLEPIMKTALYVICQVMDHKIKKTSKHILQPQKGPVISSWPFLLLITNFI